MTTYTDTLLSRVQAQIATWPKPFIVDYDFCLEGVDNVWEAHGLVCSEARIDSGDVHNVEYTGDAANGWPMLRITFSCIEVAKAYTSIYLGLGPIEKAWDVYVDEEVNEYISLGKFVG
jgi:hypothetical protein